MASPRLCRWCVHYFILKSGHADTIGANCARQRPIEIDLVDGGPAYPPRNLTLNCRYERYEGDCGVQGKYWEEK